MVYEGSEKVNLPKKAKTPELLSALRDADAMFYYQQHQQEVDTRKRKEKSSESSAAVPVKKPAKPTQRTLQQTVPSNPVVVAGTITVHDGEDVDDDMEDEEGTMNGDSGAAAAAAASSVTNYNHNHNTAEEDTEADEEDEDDDDEDNQPLDVSDYEARRLKNIRENAAMLAKLGLDAPIVKDSTGTQQKVKKEERGLKQQKRREVVSVWGTVQFLLSIFPHLSRELQHRFVDQDGWLA